MCILAGAVLGLVNGMLVAYFNVPSLVITLGTLYIYRGIVLSWAGSDRINAGDLPSDFLALGNKAFLTIPVLTIIALAVLAAVGYYLYTARGGREFYAIGSDPDAAVLYGLDVRRRVLAAFVLSGALAGLVGVLYTARYGTVSSGVGSGIELQAVAAVVIGGVAIFGGSGTVWGAAIGAFLLVTINRALPSLGIEDFWQRAVVGVLILGAIVLDRVLANRQAKQARRSKGDDDMTTPRTYAEFSEPLWRRLLLTREMAVIALTVAVVLYSSLNVPNFDGPLTLKFLLQDIAPILLIALPMTLIIITGEIDLSVASIVGLSSVVLGVLHDNGLSVPVAALIALLLGAACGALNGFLVAYVGLPSLAVTIGTLALFRGDRRGPARDQGGHRVHARAGPTWRPPRSGPPTSRSS